MRKYYKIIFVFALLGILTPSCSPAQEQQNRQAYAAGRFYENDPALLNNRLQQLFSQTKKLDVGKCLAVISPHAGFVFSGQTAAWGFRQIDASKEINNVFILGSSHTMAIPGASVYTAGNYETPLGTVKVNMELAKKLVESNPWITFLPEAHRREHSIENQLPFLQFYLKNDFNIVPILIGTDNPEALRAIAKTLKPYLNDGNLFVISSDFSHYPAYRDAQKADSLTAKGIVSNTVSGFEKAIRKNAKSRYPGLVTSACGRTALLVLLNMSQDLPDVAFTPVHYSNSGDVPAGDKSRVVGYFYIVLTQKNGERVQGFLSGDDKAQLLKIARQTIESYLKTGEVPVLNPEHFSAGLQTKTGAFVTLNKDHRLRGCIGRFITDEPLYKVVQQMAVAAATQDYRFLRVSPEEMEQIDIEISVLTPLKKIQSIDEIELGRDGIYIKKGNQSGTFLPQVATETGWNKEEFLGHCAQDKAGIGWDGWKDAELFTYRAIVFSEAEIMAEKELKD